MSKGGFRGYSSLRAMAFFDASVADAQDRAWHTLARARVSALCPYSFHERWQCRWGARQRRRARNGNNRHREHHAGERCSDDGRGELRDENSNELFGFSNASLGRASVPRVYLHAEHSTAQSRGVNASVAHATAVQVACDRRHTSWMLRPFIAPASTTGWVPRRVHTVTLQIVVCMAA